MLWANSRFCYDLFLHHEMSTACAKGELKVSGSFSAGGGHCYTVFFPTC